MWVKNWEDYLNVDIECTCGRCHSCGIEKIVLEKDAIGSLPALIMEGLYHNVCVVSDKITDEVAGKAVYQALRSNLIPFETVVLPDERPVPDELTIGRILTGMPAKCDLLIGVGAGTINDLCKYISYKLDIAYMLVATAPSMDGYTSNMASIVVDNMKTMYEAGVPKAVIAEPEILAGAPLSMLAAGAADILSKFVCLADWRLAALVTGEYHCAFVESFVTETAKAVIRLAGQIKERNEEAVMMVMEGLLLCGIAVNYIGNSRPSSGSGHYMSSYWDIFFRQQHMPSALYGARIGVATAAAARAYEILRETGIDFESLAPAVFDEQTWEAEIEEAYGSAAKEAIKLERAIHKNGADEVAARRNSLSAQIDKAAEVIEAMPASEDIIEALKCMDAPWHPSQIGIDRELVKNSIRYGMEMRNRYGLLQLLYDINEAEKMADKVTDELFS